MAITVHDIAKIAGVSSTTVSLVLNKKDDRISEQTKKRILEIAKEHNYTPNQIAVSLATKKTNTLGLILPDLTNLFFSTLARGIELIAQENGYSLFLCNSGESVEKCINYIHELEKRYVDGIFVIPPSNINQDQNHVLMQNAMNGCKIPYVLVERAVHDLFHDFITSDNEIGGYVATKHLLELGHRRIGCITGPLSEYGAQRRLSGYRSAMKEFRIQVPSEWVYEGDFHMESGSAGMEALAQAGVTAVFAGNDMMAIGVLQWAANRGIHVPDGLSVVGYDDNPLAALVSVPLTTISQPTELMGRRACEILLEKINKKSCNHRDYYFSPTLVERKSTAPPGQMD